VATTMATAQIVEANPHVDGVVVGSSAAGAAKLAAKGKKIVILESGRSIVSEDMISADIYARSLQ
jgi:choline dehydrogenase-like flavoprotein